MYQIFSYSNCLHISENKDSVIIAIDKPSEVYEWLETIKEGNYGDLFTAIYDLLRYAANEATAEE